ncbi:hypothetical protein HAX54_000804, partial [Datura stramonium]|nr:hypothetical protein [Datura stramonium]
FMASKADKEKEIEVANKGLRQLRKGTKVRVHRLREPLLGGCLALEFPTIRDKVRELGLSYIFVESEECNLTL